MTEPFRDGEAAALERISRLEEENAALRGQLGQKLVPPAETRAMPLWLLLLFVIVPVLLLITGLAAAFFLRKPEPPPPPVVGACSRELGQRLG